MAESRTQTKDVKADSKTDSRGNELPEGVTAVGYADDEKEEKKETEKARKARERSERVAVQQGEQDDADIEAFLAAQRGERLLRGGDGSYDHVAFAALQREERLAKAREDAGDGDEDEAVAAAEADEDSRAEATRLKSADLGGKDATRRG